MTTDEQRFNEMHGFIKPKLAPHFYFRFFTPGNYYLYMRCGKFPAPKRLKHTNKMQVAASFC